MTIPEKPWGTEIVTLRIAGQHYLFSGVTRGQQPRLEHHFSCPADNSQTGSAVAETSMLCGTIPCNDPIYYCIDNQYTPICRYRRDGLDIEGYGFQAEISLNDQKKCQLITRTEQEATSTFIFENYLRILAAYTSLKLGGLFLHSAGIVVNKRAFLFIGRSGAGKTTICRQAMESGHTILSDDANIALPAGSGFQAGPVPFAGELGQVNTDFVTTWPVAGIFWLEQRAKAAIEAVDPARQTAKMLACCPVVNVDPFRLDPLLNTIEKFLQQVPLRTLCFRRDQPFAVIRELLEEETNDS
jgi:hypothetical protein